MLKQKDGKWYYPRGEYPPLYYVWAGLPPRIEVDIEGTICWEVERKDNLLEMTQWVSENSISFKGFKDPKLDDLLHVPIEVLCSTPQVIARCLFAVGHVSSCALEMWFVFHSTFGQEKVTNVNIRP
jgi:hypothetical protein